MPQPRIAIIGTGLIGTSIGLVLTGRQGRNYSVVGVDTDRGRARQAKKLGAVDQEVATYREAVEGSGLVILAVPVLAAKEILEHIAPFLAEGTVVTDVCSTKSDVLRWAAEYLGPGIHFVGGHPMAGREASGPGAATVDLFKGAAWAVIPAPTASEEAVQVVLGLINVAGAEPVYIDAAEHDQYVAAVSHVPLLVSVALFRMVRESHAWEDASMLAGPAFRDLTRLASGDPTMAGDIMETNREAVLHWLERLREELDAVSAVVRGGGDAMAELFLKASLDRDTYLQNPRRRRPPEGPQAPSAQDQMWRLFMGGLYDRYKDMMDRPGSAGVRNEEQLKRKLGVRGRGR